MRNHKKKQQCKTDKVATFRNISVMGIKKARYMIDVRRVSSLSLRKNRAKPYVSRHTAGFELLINKFILFFKKN